MTASPQAPRHLLTIAEYQALGEDDQGRTELQEGSLIVTPSPGLNHMLASAALCGVIREQAPRPWRVVPDVDVDLQLAPPDGPGSCRRPDLVVVSDEAVSRVGREGGLLRTSDTLIAVEIVSPSSRRTDHVVKRAEYADAGIRYYWIVDLADGDQPATLTTCHLAEGFGYQDSGPVTGLVEVTEPFHLRIDLERLLDG